MKKEGDLENIIQFHSVLMMKDMYKNVFSESKEGVSSCETRSVHIHQIINTQKKSMVVGLLDG